MSPYYDQPGWRQRGKEDVAGALVLLSCVVLALAGTLPYPDFICTTPRVLRFFSTAPFCFLAGASLPRS